jgi:hypothetical protein
VLCPKVSTTTLHVAKPESPPPPLALSMVRVIHA